MLVNVTIKETFTYSTLVEVSDKQLADEQTLCNTMKETFCKLYRHNDISLRSNGVQISIDNGDWEDLKCE